MIEIIVANLHTATRTQDDTLTSFANEPHHAHKRHFLPVSPRVIIVQQAAPWPRSPLTTKSRHSHPPCAPARVSPVQIFQPTSWRPAAPSPSNHPKNRPGPARAPCWAFRWRACSSLPRCPGWCRCHVAGLGSTWRWAGRRWGGAEGSL